MKKLFVATIAVAALAGGSAGAADVSAPVYKMPTKAPVVRAFSWTGFYFGGNVGYGIGRNPTHQTDTEALAPGIFESVQYSIVPRGGIAGAQIGYNLQSGRLVYGIEADWQWSGQKETVCTQCLFNAAGALVQSVTEDQRLKWFGTARGRIGYAADHWLWYVTGGVAWGHVENDFTRIFIGPPTTASFDHTKTGWTLGAGVEAALDGNWSYKVEYLYIDLGHTNDAFVYPGTFVNVASIPATITTDSAIRDHIVRLGLNYRINPNGAAASSDGIFASAGPLYNWTGFYVGVNAGYGVGQDKGGVTYDTAVCTPGTLCDLFTRSPAGFVGGGQVGYNWQNRRIVYGVEADFQGSAQKETSCMGQCLSFLINDDRKLTWFGTVRGRVGYAMHQWLVYATGGFAWAKIKDSYLAGTGSVGGLVPDITTAASFSHTKTGWVVGGGVETALYGNWTGKVEYLYMDLGSVTDTFFAPSVFIAPGLNITSTSEIRNNIVRVGLNYRFGGTAAQ